MAINHCSLSSTLRTSLKALTSNIYVLHSHLICGIDLKNLIYCVSVHKIKASSVILCSLRLAGQRSQEWQTDEQQHRERCNGHTVGQAAVDSDGGDSNSGRSDYRTFSLRTTGGWLYCGRRPSASNLQPTWLLISSCSLQCFKPLAPEIPPPDVQAGWWKFPCCPDSLSPIGQELEMGEGKVQVDGIFWFLAYASATPLTKWDPAEVCRHGYIDHVRAKDLSHIWAEFRTGLLMDTQGDVGILCIFNGM